MTNEELAAHWKVSLEEAQSISDYMNKTFSMHVGKSKQDGLFYGLIYRIDERHGPMLTMSSKQGFDTPKEAADFMNETCDKMEIPAMRAKLMNVPVDAYKALKKIDTSAFETKSRSLNINKRSAERD